MTESNDEDELSGAQYRELFVVVARALAFDALRLKPREKQFALLTAAESFGEGRAFGYVELEVWRMRCEKWRSNELKKLLAEWRRAGWIAVDVTEGTFRLAPDRLPGWADVQGLQRAERRMVPLRLVTAEDLHKTFAKISQQVASGSLPPAKKSQEVAKISQPGAGPVQRSERLDVKTSSAETLERLHVERPADCENFAAVSHRGQPDPDELAGQIRAFVGEADWCSEKFWDQGRGWRRKLLEEEGEQLARALAFVSSKDAPRTRRTNGARLWDEFQRLRQLKV